MSHRTERGAQERGLRSSALWSSGSRGGDSRSSVLWGKGGRGLVATCILLCALAVPLAATATPSTPSASGGTFVAKSLLAKAKTSPGEKVSVIIQSTGGAAAAETALRGVGGGELKKQLGLVGAVSADLPAKLVERLQGVPGLTVTPDATVKLAGLSSPVKSTQLWPYV